MSGEYRYLFYDFETNTSLGELEMSNVTYGRVLNGAGRFVGYVSLGDPRVVAKDPITLTEPPGAGQPARRLYVDRDGAIEWAGIVWARRYDDSTHLLEVDANELWSYFQVRGSNVGRFITDTLSWSQQDQLDIARDLVAYAQGRQLNAVAGAPITYAKPGGDLGILASSGSSGVLRDLNYDFTAYQELADAVQQLSALSGGFDFSIDTAYSSGVPAPVFVASYPRRGQTFQAGTGVILQKPGNVSAYTYAEDGNMVADVSYAIGDGTGSSMMRSTASRPDMLDGGVPLLEQRISYKGSGITAQATLDAHALADVNAAAAASTAASVTFRAGDPSGRPVPVSVGSFTTGDDCRLWITDERFPNPGYQGQDQHLDVYLRIIAYEVQVVGGTAPELVVATLGPTG